MINDILAWLEASIADARLNDAERRELAALLSQAETPEEGLRRVRNRAFALVRERLLAGTEALDLLQWTEGVVRTLDGVRTTDSARAEVFFSPGNACLEAINRQLRAARERVDICVFTISDDRISREILAAHRRGVALRILTDDDKREDQGSDIDELAAAGIPVAMDRSPAHMHHKFALFDGRILLNGSYNWTRSAAADNEENIVLSSDASLLASFAAQFERMWQAWR